MTKDEDSIHVGSDVYLQSILKSPNERIQCIEIVTIRDVIEQREVLVNEMSNTEKDSETNNCSVGGKDEPCVSESNLEEKAVGKKESNAAEEDKIRQENSLVDSVDGGGGGDLNISDASIYYDVDSQAEELDKNSGSGDFDGSDEQPIYPNIQDVMEIEANFNQSNARSEDEIIAVAENKGDNEKPEIVNDGDKEEVLEKITMNDNKSESDLNTENGVPNKTIVPDDSLNNADDEGPGPGEFLQRHPNIEQFGKLSKTYYKFIERYHLGDTVPLLFRGQLQMQLRSMGANFLNIGLFGEAGSGKSAFLNSLYTAINGNYVEYSAERRTDSDYEESATDKRVELRLTETLTVLDNRGTDFSKESMKEIVKQCGMILCGVTIIFL